MIVKQKRKRKIPKHFEKFFVKENVQKPTLTSEKQFKTGSFYCILDNIINELNKRFIDNSNILCRISALNPKAKQFLSYDLLVPLANHYLCDTISLRSELNIVYKSIKIYEKKFNVSVKNIFVLHTFLLEYQIAFLNYLNFLL